MTRDVAARLNMLVCDPADYQAFAAAIREKYGAGTDPADLDEEAQGEVWERVCGGPRPKVGVDRVALNMDQIEQFRPPPNPAKELDKRAAGYIRRYGRQCWELDALDPSTLAALIRPGIGEYI